MDQFLTGVGFALRRALCLLVVAICLFPGWCMASDAMPASGLGLQVAPLSTGEVVVLAVVDESPAAQAEMRPGDVILVINDIPLAGRDFRMSAREFFWNETIRDYRILFARPGVEGVQNLSLSRSRLRQEPQPLPGIEMLTPQSVESGGTP